MPQTISKVKDGFKLWIDKQIIPVYLYRIALLFQRFVRISVYARNMQTYVLQDK